MLQGSYIPGSARQKRKYSSRQLSLASLPGSSLDRASLNLAKPEAKGDGAVRLARERLARQSQGPISLRQAYITRPAPFQKTREAEPRLTSGNARITELAHLPGEPAHPPRACLRLLPRRGTLRLRGWPFGRSNVRLPEVIFVRRRWCFGRPHRCAQSHAPCLLRSHRPTRLRCVGPTHARIA